MKNLFTFTRILVIVFLILLSNHLLFAQNVDPSPGSQNFLAWLQENWAILLLAISEILALLPGAQSGIMKIIITLIRKLAGSLASKKNP